MSKPSYMKWLTPEALEKIQRLEFLAHGTVDGFVSGRHRSSRKGASAEFAEHRAYSPGDDLRKLDWKLVARRQRLYVREYVDETNLRATVALDTSGSMAYRSKDAAGGLTKFDYARHVAALLAYLLIRQQDGVGFVRFDSKVNLYMPAKAQPLQLKQILESIDGAVAARETDVARPLHDIAERIPRRGVVFVVSDLYGESEALAKALAHLRFRHHEVILLQVVDPAERTFPFTDVTQFEDLETATRLNVDARALRNEYLRRYEAHAARLAAACGELRIVHELLDTSVPVDRALADVLVRYHEGRR